MKCVSHHASFSASLLLWEDTELPHTVSQLQQCLQAQHTDRLQCRTQVQWRGPDQIVQVLVPPGAGHSWAFHSTRSKWERGSTSSYFIKLTYCLQTQEHVILNWEAQTPHFISAKGPRATNFNWLIPGHLTQPCNRITAEKIILVYKIFSEET